MSGIMVGDGEAPNPEEFKIQMRTVRAGEDSAMRHDDYVGSYSHTGRKKLEKKWTPSKKPEAGDNAFRADDWMGSGKQPQKTWKVKSAKATGKADDGSKPGEFVSPESGKSVRKWHPPPKDQAALPPWMSPVSDSIKKPVTPKRHSAPIDLTCEQKSESERIFSDHHGVDAGVEEQIGTDCQGDSTGHANSSPSKVGGSSTRRVWQSHGDIDVLKAQESLAHERHSGDEDSSREDDEDEANDQKSDKEEKRAPPLPGALSAETEKAIAKSVVNATCADHPPAVGIVVGDDDDKPDPEQFKIQMRSVRAGEDSAMRHDDFVGAYNNTGRVKLDKKKWAPSHAPEAGDNAFRADDWMGSGKRQSKTWKIKSGKSSVRSDSVSKPGEYVSTDSTEVTRTWKPPPKDQAVPPPWMATVPEPSTPHHEAPQTQKQSTPVIKQSDHIAESEASSSNTHQTNADETATDAPGCSTENDISSSTKNCDVDVLKIQESVAEVNVADDEQNHEVAPDVEDEAIDAASVKEEIGGPKPSGAAFQAKEESAEPHVSVPNPGKSDQEDHPSIVGLVVGDYDDDRPDPEQFKIQMRTVRAGEDSAMRHDDFVGSYNHTGRVKLEKKKWNPSKKPEAGDNAFRADDWMGSGKKQPKSWKVKN